MITQIEKALVERLQKGLGRLVATVKSYGGELDDDSLAAVRLPLCSVSFGGARITKMATSGKRFQSRATFVVLLAVRSLKSNVAARQGGADKREVGVNTLIGAVRRLLDNQTLGGLVKPLVPVQVRTLFNNVDFNSAKITAYTVEFEAVFDDVAPLEDGRFPEATDDETSPDYVFNAYQGELSEPEPDWLRTQGVVFDPITGAQVPYEDSHTDNHINNDVKDKEQENESESR